jgi:hypothetical protein
MMADVVVVVGFFTGPIHIRRKIIEAMFVRETYNRIVQARHTFFRFETT